MKENPAYELWLEENIKYVVPADFWPWLEAAFEGGQGVRSSQHPDDLAIDRFAARLKVRMAAGRAKGRYGWDDAGECTVEDLSIGLRVHVGKGDPVDVALYCMMLDERGSGIVSVRAPAGTPAASAEFMAELDRQIAEKRETEERRRVARESGGRRKGE